MSANPIIYCLEHLTDYRDFEQLCCDLMANAGYPDIEPIGGTGDRGRDAVHYSKSNNELSIFAFTVRSDWFKKLKEDCKRIYEEEHNPNNIVYVCTSALSGDEKDKAKKYVIDVYGWSIELYDIERIRVMLTGESSHLIANHPSIFCPPWFSRKGGLTISDARDTLIIDHVLNDHALATWLAKKLSITGYKVWCYGISPFAGEDYDESIRTLLESRALLYIPIISHEAFKDTDFIARIGGYQNHNDFLIPCWASNMDDISSSTKVLNLEPARFDSTWTSGLSSVLNALDARGATPALERGRGKHIALQSYIPEPLTKNEAETIYSNVFHATVPKSIIVWELDRGLGNDEIENLRTRWAFVLASRYKLLSFDIPPCEIPRKSKNRAPEYLWSEFENHEGKNSINVIKELLRRSLFLSCSEAGLNYCQERNVYYYPVNDGLSRKIKFTHLDGRKTHVAMTGTKQDGWGERASKFRYQLGPQFKVWIDDNNQFWVTARIYVRVTDMDGRPFKEKEIIRKRKKVTKAWWNKQWLARTLGLMKGLANNSQLDAIEIGSEDKRKVSVSITPLAWECPTSIDVEAVDRIGNFQQEIATARSPEYEDEDIEIAEEES